MRVIRLGQQRVQFLKRNEGLHIILGSLILFTTFVIRDVLIERLRSTTDAIYAAETTYLLRDASITLHHEGDQLDAHVAEVLVKFRPRR